MIINFLCRWNNKNKEYSWSGTNYGILTSLSKKFEINEVSLPNYRLIKVLKKIHLSLLAYKLQNVLDNILVKRKLKGNVIFTFESVYFGKKYKYFSYNDLTLSYLYELSKSDKFLYESSGFKYKKRELQFISKREQKIFEKYSCLFSMSQFLKDFLDKNTSIKSKVTYAGVNIKITKTKKGTSNSILFVGKDYTRKNAQLVYKAFKILKEEISDLILYIAGPKNNPFEETDGYVFLGELKYENLIPYFEESLLFCMPSKFEAFGIVFCEAQAYGLPCIGYNNFEMKNLIDSNRGYLINDLNDVNELATTIKHVINNKPMQEYCFNMRNEASEKYNWDRVAEEMSIEILKHIL